MAIGPVSLPNKYKEAIKQTVNTVNNTISNVKKDIKTTTQNLVIDPVKKAIKDTGFTGAAIGVGTGVVEAKKQNVPTGKAIVQNIKTAAKGGVIEVAVRTSYNMVESYYSPNGAQRKYINGQQ